MADLSDGVREGRIRRRRRRSEPADRERRDQGDAAREAAEERPPAMNPNMSPIPRLRRPIATLRNLIAPIALALLSSASAQPLVTNEPGGPTKPFKPSVRIKAEGPLAFML